MMMTSFRSLCQRGRISALAARSTYARALSGNSSEGGSHEDFAPQRKTTIEDKSEAMAFIEKVRVHNDTCQDCLYVFRARLVK